MFIQPLYVLIIIIKSTIILGYTQNYNRYFTIFKIHFYLIW